MDGLTHLFKPAVNIRIRVSQDSQTLIFQIPCSLRIITLTLIIIMLRAIDFNHQLGRNADKINDIRTNNPLFIKFNRIGPQEKIP